MRRYNVRERWKARTYTPFVLIPWLWALLMVLYAFAHITGLGLDEFNPDSTGPNIAFHMDSNDVSGVLVFLALSGGCVIAFLRRRTRRGRMRVRGWVIEKRWVRRYDGRFHLFPFGPLTRVRATQSAHGDLNGTACASFTLWPRWQVVRRFYDVDLVELPAVLPSLALFPQQQYDRMAAALGGTDILTESDDFNREWRVVGRDERYALAVLHPLMMAALLREGAVSLPITIEGGAILTWHPGRSALSGLGARLATLRGLAALIPKHVWDDFGTPRSDAWGPPGELSGPLWDPTLGDSAARNLYPGTAEMYSGPRGDGTLAGFFHALRAMSIPKNGGPQSGEPGQVVIPEVPATLGTADLYDLDDLDDVDVEETQAFAPEEDGPRP